MILPLDLEDIVLDYFYSRWVFERKQCFHREIHHLWMLEEVKLFYNIFYSPINIHPTTYYDAIISEIL
jgi:hypothetical protein